MTIKITKKQGRAILICTREDGSYTRSETGGQVPFHDIGHVIAERTLNIKEGFYGNIKNGYTIEQLSDKNVIKGLGADAWLSEIVTRALGSLYTGSCTLAEFIPLIETEMKGRGEVPPMSQGLVKQMLQEYTELLDKWHALQDNESLVMEFL